MRHAISYSPAPRRCQQLSWRSSSQSCWGLGVSPLGTSPAWMHLDFPGSCAVAYSKARCYQNKYRNYKAQKCLILPEEIGKDELSLVPENFLRIQELWADVLDNVAVVKWQEEWSTCIKWVPKKKYPIIQIQVTLTCAHLMESKHYSVFMI